MTVQRYGGSVALVLWLGLAGCATLPGGSSGGWPGSSDGQVQQRRTVIVDGSSTVFPITEAIAEQFQSQSANSTAIDMSFSGTGGGFRKFCAGETDISNASRPISAEEIASCDANQVRYYELPVAFDALTVVVNPQNSWADSITLEELKTLWAPGAQGKITNWSQVRPSWPDQTLSLYGPGMDSGTYDYFTEVVLGQPSRSDFVASEDDDLLVQGVAQTSGALGYFGLAYVEANPGSVKPLAVDSGRGPVTPTADNVVQATYQPLSRPLFIYVNYTSAQRNPALREFVEFYLEQAPQVVNTVGYIPLSEEAYNIALVNFHKGQVGTVFDGVPQPNLTLGEVLRKTRRIK